MRSVLSLCALLATAPSAAEASNWLSAGSSSNGTKYEIDADSINLVGQTVTFWLKAHYNPNQPRKGDADSYVARRQANCSDRSYIDVQTNYLRNEHLMSVTHDDPIQYAAPDTVAAALLDLVCPK